MTLSGLRDFAGKAAGPLERVARYRETRETTVRLCEPLEVEDCVVQTMADVSPPKWHLAHTTWFFETFLLKPFLRDYCEFHPEYNFLFNSYYDSIGDRWPRPRRGLLSRPTVAEIRAYRAHVDAAMSRLLEGIPSDGDVASRLELGLQHEQQHQELLLSDIKHILGENPLQPVYATWRGGGLETASTPLTWSAFPGGLTEIGWRGDGFCFDNERPVHRVWLEDFRLANRLTTNEEYLAFIDDGGYRRPELWLDEGWQWRGLLWAGRSSSASARL